MLYIADIIALNRLQSVRTHVGSLEGMISEAKDKEEEEKERERYSISNVLVCMHACMYSDIFHHKWLGKFQKQENPMS